MSFIHSFIHPSFLSFFLLHFSSHRSLSLSFIHSLSLSPSFLYSFPLPFFLFFFLISLFLFLPSFFPFFLLSFLSHLLLSLSPLPSPSPFFILRLSVTPASITQLHRDEREKKTKRVDNERHSPASKHWNWSWNSTRTSTSLALAVSSWLPALISQKHKSRSGSRTAEQKTSGWRRLKWTSSSDWPVTPWVEWRTHRPISTITLRMRTTTKAHRVVQSQRELTHCSSDRQLSISPFHRGMGVGVGVGLGLGWERSCLE